MDNQTENRMPILHVAWVRYAQMDAASKKLERRHYSLRRWISVFGVLSVIFAVLTETYPETFLVTGRIVLKSLLILSPIVVSLLAVIYNKFHGGGFLILRAGAEEILKEIYVFRTINKNNPKRRPWLEKRLAEIQRQVYRGLDGEMVLEQYEGAIPPYHNSENPESDPGFGFLNGDDYFVYRLQNQLAWYIRKINKIQKERKRLHWAIGAAGVLGATLAALDFYLWVAIAAAFAIAFIGWQELRNLDNTLRNYSKVITELTILYNHWLNLEPEEQTEKEFHKMVRKTEGVLWSQNVEFVCSAQGALSLAEFMGSDLVHEVSRKSVEEDAHFINKWQEFEKAFGSIVEEASSELVQQELAAMNDATEQVIERMVKRTSKLRSIMNEIAADYAEADVNADTPASELHALMQRYPKTGEVKG